MTERRKPIKMFKTAEESFAYRTEQREDCLVWVGGLDSSGYGLIWDEGRKKKAHRYAWESANGPIPEGMLLDHTCFNRACVDVSHLRLVTVSQNSRNRAGANKTNRLSGVRNVYLEGTRYLVRVGRKRFGRYSTVEEAAVVADRARAEVFGVFAGRGVRAPGADDD